MQETYTPSAIESAVQQAWQQADVYRVTEHATDVQGKVKPKYYACSMLPYPSGKLHMGHVRNYTINDMLVRHLRMKGYNVLMPMGWDAFGLPAENAAMKNNVPPAQWTMSNIAYMKKQMQTLGLAIDWSREIATCTPEYYRWNQWFFLQMLKTGMAYRKTQIVNWDPVDSCVLANEQVINGKGWRSGAAVEKREIPGYYLNITDHAPELLSHVQNGLPGWPERVKSMQENWIGKNEGVRFAFLDDEQVETEQKQGLLYVFTTRIDTLLGVTFVAVAPEHPLAARAIEQAPEDQKTALNAAIQSLKEGGTTEAEMATKEKMGVNTGLFVRHPLTNAQIPVWVGNYVLMSYGDGAVMGVPAHDERDFAFAHQYGLDIKPVVAVVNKDGVQLPFDAQTWQDAYAQKHNAVLVNSGEFDGLSVPAAVELIAAALLQKGLGERKTTWRLRDWGISRQRYWGTPIPVVHCAEHGAQPVPEHELPVVLPLDCVPDGSGNPLVHHEGFHAGATCPICGAKARRETDTMDTFVDSSWYFLRYCDPHNVEKMVGPDAANYWMPMDQYIGGIEHAILHLLYARFWNKAMHKHGLVQCEEPFTHLLTQGMVLNHIYSRKTPQGAVEYFWPQEVENITNSDGKITTAKSLLDGSLVNYDGVGTMSKSKNNGVDPQLLTARYGADTARVYTMFTAPPEATLEWNEAAVEGSHRFLRRVWALAVKLKQQIGIGVDNTKSNPKITIDEKTTQKLRFELHTTLQQINGDFERMQYNTVVSGCMKLLNALEVPNLVEKVGTAVWSEGISILLRCLYPAAPHITQAAWNDLGFGTGFSLLDASWPEVDVLALVQNEIEMAVQINGKLRGTLLVSANLANVQIEALVLEHEAVRKLLSIEGVVVKKIIVVPKRLVNVVVS